MTAVADDLTSTAMCSERSPQPIRRSKVTSKPSAPPGPTRPFTSALVIALSCQPWGSVIVEELLKLAAGHLPADQALTDLDDLVLVALSHRLPPLGGKGPKPRPTRTASAGIGSHRYTVGTRGNGRRGTPTVTGGRHEYQGTTGQGPIQPPPGNLSGGGPEFESAHPWPPRLARDLPETTPRLAKRATRSPRTRDRSTCGNLVGQR